MRFAHRPAVAGGCRGLPAVAGGGFATATPLGFLRISLYLMRYMKIYEEEYEKD